MKPNLMLWRGNEYPRPVDILVARMLVCCLAFVFFLPLVQAQGNGVVEGRLVNKTNPSILAAEVELDVVGLGGGMSIIKSSKTDKGGKFRLDGLPTDSPLMIRANYKDVNYHGRVSFDAAGKATVEIAVYEPTTSMAGIRLEGARFAFQLAGDQLRSMELYSFSNDTSPPRSYMNMEGNFRFSKAAGIVEPPKMNVTGPGSAMPLNQSPLESPDGKSYYSLYPLRPGTTTFEVDQVLPYTSKTYTLKKKFYYDVESYEIGVIPQDVTVSGEGIAKLQADAQRNFAVFRGGPVKAGTEVAWTLSGGTPMAEPAPAAPQGEPRVKPVPTLVARNSTVLGPLLLLGLIVVLWYAFTRIPEMSGEAAESRARELRTRRDQLLNQLAGLDNQYEDQKLDRRVYLRLRDQGKRQLRRVSLLLKKND